MRSCSNRHFSFNIPHWCMWSRWDYQLWITVDNMLHSITYVFNAVLNLNAINMFSSLLFHAEKLYTVKFSLTDFDSICFIIPNTSIAFQNSCMHYHCLPKGWRYPRNTGDLQTTWSVPLEKMGAVKQRLYGMIPWLGFSTNLQELQNLKLATVRLGVFWEIKIIVLICNLFYLSIQNWQCDKLMASNITWLPPCSG